MIEQKEYVKPLFDKLLELASYIHNMSRNIVPIIYNKRGNS